MRQISSRQEEDAGMSAEVEGSVSQRVAPDMREMLVNC